jgi:hypothetical protein
MAADAHAGLFGIQLAANVERMSIWVRPFTSRALMSTLVLQHLGTKEMV